MTKNYLVLLSANYFATKNKLNQDRGKFEVGIYDVIKVANSYKCSGYDHKDVF